MTVSWSGITRSPCRSRSSPVLTTTVSRSPRWACSPCGELRPADPAGEHDDPAGAGVSHDPSLRRRGARSATSADPLDRLAVVRGGQPHDDRARSRGPRTAGGRRRRSPGSRAASARRPCPASRCAASVAAYAASASAASSRMMIGKLIVSSISSKSRPTSAQWPRGCRASRVTSSTVPEVFQASARSGRRPERLLRAGAADEDRQVGLDRARLAERVRRVGRTALVAEPLAVEQPPHDPDGLVESIQPLPEAGAPVLDPERLVLALEPGAADAEHGPPVADVVEGRRELRRQPRVAERVRPDHQPEPDPPRDRGRGRRASTSPRGSAAPTARRSRGGDPTSRPSPSRRPRPRSAVSRNSGQRRLLRPELGPELASCHVRRPRGGRGSPSGVSRKLTRCCGSEAER